MPTRNLPILTSRENHQWHIKENITTVSYSYKIEVSQDKLIALFSIKMHSAISSRIINEIYQKLKHSKIVLKNISSLDYALKNMNQLGELNDFILSIGSAPLHGCDAIIEILYEKDGLELPTEDIDRVDYKSINKIASVRSGDILGRYIKETLGEDGSDVFDQKIIAHKGKASNFVASQNTELDSEEMVIRATSDGLPSSKLGFFKIEPALMVETDLDLSVGNIDYGGSVSINGDVLDGFKIIAGGDVFIRGIVGACDIISSGKIIIHGGIVGKGKCSIKCKELFAKFMHEAQVEADENICIMKEIIGSKCYCNGKLIAKVIIGGKTIVKENIEVFVLGSEQNVETLIEIGTDFNLLNQYENAITRIPELDADLAKEAELFQQFVLSPQQFFKLEKEKVTRVWKLFQFFKTKVEDRLQMESKLDESLLAFQLGKSKIKTILVHKFIYENVKFISRFSFKKVEEIEKGPLVIKENYLNKTFSWNLPL